MSYKNLSNLGITSIKPSAKGSNECLKDIHYRINQLVYEWQFTWLSPEAARYIVGKLQDFRSELITLKDSISNSCYDRWVEIGKAVSQYIEALEKYASEVKYDFIAEGQVLKKFVAPWVKDKDSFTVDEMFAMAQRNKLFSSLYTKADIPSFKVMQKQLIERISKGLEL